MCSAALFLLPEQDTALVLQQNLYGLLTDEAVLQAAFGAAPADAPSASFYRAAVWGSAVLALALLLAAVRSALLLRRPAPATLPRRNTLTFLWCLAGALPWGIAVPFLSRMSRDQLMTWVPDVTLALWSAVLRLVLAFRAPLLRRGGTGRRTAGRARQSFASA
ncbi:hypothetical protein ACL02R_24030 [Streptomyces sp. MS19]|uniref:hypothetical protein n=1 Tax=Streptomyces sp. MS19 TaxID=3385972 RepID=UPI0039A3C584